MQKRGFRSFLDSYVFNGASAHSDRSSERFVFAPSLPREPLQETDTRELNDPTATIHYAE